MSLLRRTTVHCTLLLAFMQTASCQWILGEPDMDPCDPAHNYYEGERHYFGRDYVQEDGTLNQKRMLHALEPGNGECANPEEIIRQAQSTTDADTVPQSQPSADPDASKPKTQMPPAPEPMDNAGSDH